MKVAVLGAGVVGVTTAWCLRQTGHDVVAAMRKRLGDRLRIAGTAEPSGYNTEINKVRCDASWTHACGAGPILADMVSGRQPEIDLFNPR